MPYSYDNYVVYSNAVTCNCTDDSDEEVEEVEEDLHDEDTQLNHSHEEGDVSTEVSVTEEDVASQTGEDVTYYVNLSLLSFNVIVVYIGPSNPKKRSAGVKRGTQQDSTNDVLHQLIDLQQAADKREEEREEKRMKLEEKMIEEFCEREKKRDDREAEMHSLFAAFLNRITSSYPPMHGTPPPPNVHVHTPSSTPSPSGLPPLGAPHHSVFRPVSPSYYPPDNHPPMSSSYYSPDIQQ